MINIAEHNGKLTVSTPYDKDYIAKARDLGGKWQSAEKVWSFNSELREDVEAALKEVFMWRPSVEANEQTVTLRITINKSMTGYKESIKFGPYVLAQAYGRDTGAKPGQHVAKISGTIRSGGSVKNWETRISAGTTFKIVNVPKTIADELIAYAAGKDQRFIADRQDFDGVDRPMIREHEHAPYLVPLNDERPEGVSTKTDYKTKTYRWVTPIYEQKFSVIVE